MNDIWGFFLFVSLCGLAWNVVALILSWFGIFAPVVEVIG